MRTFIFFTLCFIFLDIGKAQGPILDSNYSEEAAIPQVYIVKQDRVPVYKSAEGNIEILSALELKDLSSPKNFIKKLKDKSPISSFLRNKFSSKLSKLLAIHKEEFSPKTLKLLIKELNSLLKETPIYQKEIFAKVKLSQKTQKLLKKDLTIRDIQQLNRCLLEDSYPQEILPSTQLEMGELFFGLEEKNNRVYLGKYSQLEEKFTKAVGWVELKNLLKNRYPITVKQAVKSGYLTQTMQQSNSRLATAFSIKNELFLRTISKPEVKVQPGSIPGSVNRDKFFTFTWYYVYSITKKNGHIYYLIGSKADLFDVDFVMDTQNTSAQKNLLGWIKKKQVKEWCSNIVLEYNTQKESIEERYLQNKPAIVYAKKKLGLVKAKEPFDIWKPYFDGSTQKGHLLAQPDPFGMLPEMPRFHVLQKVNNWFQVATLGSLQNRQKKISQSKIARLIYKLRTINQKLRSVDLVFIIDGTGSMYNEIKAVKQFLVKLCEEFTKMSKSGKSTIQFKVGVKNITLPTYMDIKASLILYQDINEKNGAFKTKIFFKSLPLTQLSTIDQAFINMKLLGNNEALYDGLSLALSTKELWRPYAARVALVVADEPGDIGGKTQKEVFEQMPLPKSKFIKSLGTFQKLNKKTFKLEYTKIYGIYTGSNFTKFRKNLDMLTDTRLFEGRVFHLPNFKKVAQERKEELIKIIYESIEKAKLDIDRRLQTLTDKIKDNQKVKKENNSASVVMDQIAIHEAAKSAKTSVKELLQLNRVAYVEGYVKQQKNHTYNTFRIRVALSRESVLELERKTTGLSRGLSRAIKAISKPGFLRTANPKSVVAQTLILAIAHVNGTYEDYIDNDRQLRKEARFLIRSKGQNGNIKRLLGVKESLPVSSSGLLGIPIKKILSMKLKDLKKLANQLRLKSRCLRNIINSETTPEDVNKLSSFEKFPKNWVYKHPQSGIEFIYVPIQYIP